MEPMQFCHSCGIPLMSPAAGEVRGNYCGNCSDTDGHLKPRDEVRAGIAHWLISFSPETSMDVCMQRADYYLKSMPAWAER